MGDSAGANIALSMMQQLQQDQQPLPCGIVLFAPYLDLTTPGRSIDENESTDIFSR